MNLLAGIKNSLLIDDSYNASPKTLVAALEVLRDIEYHGRKVAVLGDMLELGDEALDDHRAMGRFIKDAGVDLLITVGGLAAEMDYRCGLEKDQIKSFNNSKEAAQFLQNNLQEGDLVLVKGSQGARMERVSRALLSKQLDPVKCLVRQDGLWAKI